MDLSPTDEQHQLASALDALLDDLADADAVRAAEASNGFSATLYDALGEVGVWAMGLPESVGGMGASLADLAVAAAACAAHVAPVPVVEVLVAGRLLAECASDDERLPGIAAGTTIAVLAPRVATDGIARVVPGAAIADHVVAFDGDRLIVVDGPGRSGSTIANTAHAPLADVAVGPGSPGYAVLASGTDATRLFDVAQDEWRALTAVWLCGLARAALDLGVTYAKERRQFGVPIGSFQAVAHPLADVACALDGAELLAAKAVWALDENETIGPRFASTAFCFAGETAERATKIALHTHGGYGFMDEYDVQLYFRRAKSTRLLLGDPRRELQVLADRIVPVDAEGRPVDLAATTKPVVRPSTPSRAERRGPDFRLGTDVETFEAEVSTFLAEHVTADVIERAHATGTIHDWGLHRAMAAQGWISAGWPVEYGGGGRSPLEMNVLSEQMYLSGAPVDGIGVASLVAHTILLEGTEWQKSTIVPEILSGEKITALGYSEPESGSDVAACATKAVRDGDTWTINGSKMFTTLAHEASYVFLLTRTNPDVAKHKGLTMFVVPLDSPGIEISPVHTMGGERTNITYYDDVVVDDRYRVGAVDGGWGVMMTALVFERNSAWYGEAVRLLDHAVQWAARTPGVNGCATMLGDPLVRERIASAAIGNEVSNLLGWRAAWLASIGTLPSVEGTMAKLFTTEHYQRAASDLVDLLGADGVRRHGDASAPADGWIEATERHCQVTTIYGGTSEVLRGIIAQRGLGLPRSG
ncbi:MAG: acyl-CoA dehydrogenase family protein [Actinobacteria bacterium]|nr:acyl-CoA dehydrogenase family protein [Actinomycetota bacterium]